ncbi:MAG: D-alanyl-D-alanine carboxypeptidase [Pseudomonadota bacterium]
MAECEDWPRPRPGMSRRSFLTGAAALVPVAACADAPVTAPLPPVRPAPATQHTSTISAAPAARTDPLLSGRSGFALMDLDTGRMLEAEAADQAFLPASVTKIPTALYALETLGPGHRFATTLIATGPVRGGVLEGDLILRGGGDPTLDTDGLAELAAQAARAGIRRVAGRFLTDASALPFVAKIDPGQPVQAAYNPTISGLSLNFNRVFFEWNRARTPQLSLEARARVHSPAVRHISVSSVPRSWPVFAWEDAPGGGEHWTVAAEAMRRRGGRWLPVRDPAAYAGDVFRTLAAAHGLQVPPAQPAQTTLQAQIAQPAPTQPLSPASLVPQSQPQPQPQPQPQSEFQPLPQALQGEEIARWSSAGLTAILRGMLKFSTNLTAEMVGLSASAKRGLVAGDLAGSATAMRDWLSAYCALATPPEFANHSGLSAQTILTPAQTVAMLAAEERRAPGRLAGLLKPVRLPKTGLNGTPPVGMAVAKTGTLAFARGLAGFVTTGDGRRLVFAIYATDLQARAAARLDLDQPRGSRSWIRRARAQETNILLSWLAHYNAAG